MPLNNCIKQPVEGLFIPIKQHDRFAKLVGIKWRIDDPQSMYNEQWIYIATARKKDKIQRGSDGNMKTDRMGMPVYETKYVVACHQADDFRKFLSKYEKSLSLSKKEAMQDDIKYEIWFSRILDQFARECNNNL